MVIYISNDEMEKCKKIVVVGSTNVDLIARVSHLPEPGETIGDAEYCLSYGGKGANQAIAAARSGGHVSFISCLGDDAYADTLITSFVDSGIDVDYIQKCETLYWDCFYFCCGKWRELHCCGSRGK